MWWKSNKRKKRQKRCINVLTGINCVIIISSLSMIGFGMFLKVGGSVLRSQFEFVTSSLTEQLESAGLKDVQLSNFDIVQLLQLLSTPMIALGAYLFVLSVCGSFVAKKKIAVLLIMYTVLNMLGLIMVVTAAFVLFLNRQLIDEYLKSYLLTGLHENYRGYNETNFLSQTWNIAMVTLNCCGVSDYTDFKEAKQWRRKLYEDGWWFELKTPLTCCNMDKKELDQFACAVNPIDLTSYYSQGCYAAFWTLFDSYRGFPMSTFIGLIIVQLVLTIASAILVQQIRNRSKKEPDETNQRDECTKKENDENGCEYTLKNGLFQNLPFLGLSGERNNLANIFQQNQDGRRRYSFNPDFLSQLLSGTRRFSQMPSSEFGFPQGRMHSFDFGIPHGRMPSFEFGHSSTQIPPFAFGDPQGPVILHLPQQQPNESPALKAITESSEEVNCAEPKAVKDTTQTEITKSKKNIPKFERCKSENCINLKNKKSQQLAEETRPVLNRRKTVPNNLKSKNETLTIEEEY